MLKFWAIAFLGIAILQNVAICTAEDSFESLSMKLLSDLPRHFKEAIEEVEKEDAAITSKGLGPFRFNWIPQCLKDYGYIYWAAARDRNITGWPTQGIVSYCMNFENCAQNTILDWNFWYAKKQM